MKLVKFELTETGLHYTYESSGRFWIFHEDLIKPRIYWSMPQNPFYWGFGSGGHR